MKKYFALVKLLFSQQFKSRQMGDDKSVKKRRTGTVIALIVLGLCFVPFLISLAVAMYFMGKISQGNVYVGTFLLLGCQGLVLMFGVHAIISNVFVVRDADKLMYLPIRPSTIFFAKLTVAYINEVITTAVTIVVLLFPFGIGAGASVGYYAMLLIALAIIPLLPMLLGCIVAMPLAALIAKIGKNSALRTVLRVVVYLAVMAIYMYALHSLGILSGSGSGNLLDDPELFISDILTDFVARLQRVVVYVHPNFMLMSSMLATSFTGWLFNFGIAVAENAVLLGAVVLISMPFYKWMIAQSLEEGGGVRKKNTGEQLNVKNKGVVRELILTDFKRVVRDGQMGFQAFAGIVVLPLIVVIFYFSLGMSSDGDASFLDMVSSSSLYQVIAPLAILGYMTMLGMGTNVLGLYPISRENKSIYMLKSLPVSFSKILLAKVLLATAVMLVCDFLTCLLIVVLMGIKWYFGVIMLIAMALLGFGSMCITTLLDLKEPKLGWSNFNQSLKNAKNSWIAMLIGLLTIAVIATISVGFVLWFTLFEQWFVAVLMWLVLIGVAFAFAAISYKVMTNKATKYFEQIEA